MKTAVVTGASGFIGHALIEHLLADGYHVYAVTRDRERLEGISHAAGLICVEADFTKYSELSRVIPGADVFFHLAWAGGFEPGALKNYELQLSNAKYTCDALTAALKIGVDRFVYAATVNEIEIQQFINAFDTFQTRPTCIYATAKLAAELMCRTIAQANGLHYNAGLIPILYGEGNRSKQLVNVVLTALIQNESPKLVTGNNLYDLVSVKDVARALEAIGEEGQDGKRYYVGHRCLKTFKEWMQEIGEIVNPNVELRFGEYQDPLDLDYSLMDLDALYRDTGFMCSENFQGGILEHKRWLESQITIKGK